MGRVGMGWVGYLLRPTLRAPDGANKGRHQLKKNVFFWALPESPKPPPMTPIRATWSFFSDVKNDVLARITERSKDDYDNDVSDNCDHNFGTFALQSRILASGKQIQFFTLGMKG